MVARRLLLLVLLHESPREAAIAPSRGTAVARGLSFSLEEGSAGGRSCSPLTPLSPVGLLLPAHSV